MYFDITRRTLSIFAGGAFSVAFILGWALVEAPDDKSGDAAMKWRIPEKPKQNIEGSIRVLDKKNILGKKEAAPVRKKAAPPPKPKNVWKLLGFINEGDTFQALIFDVDSSKTYKLKKGDTLPDKQKIFDIQKDELVYGHDAKDPQRKAFYTYTEAEALAEAAAVGLNSRKPSPLKAPKTRPRPPSATMVSLESLTKKDAEAQKDGLSKDAEEDGDEKDGIDS